MTASSDLVAVVERLRNALSDSSEVIAHQSATILALEADKAALVDALRDLLANLDEGDFISETRMDRARQLLQEPAQGETL